MIGIGRHLLTGEAAQFGQIARPTYPERQRLNYHARAVLTLARKDESTIVSPDVGTLCCPLPDGSSHKRTPRLRDARRLPAQSMTYGKVFGLRSAGYAGRNMLASGAECSRWVDSA